MPGIYSEIDFHKLLKLMAQLGAHMGAAVIFSRGLFTEAI